MLQPTGPAANNQTPAFGFCPRTQPSQGKDDWLRINDLRFTNFDICPTCFDTSINPTQYRRFFTKAPKKPVNILTYCDFGRYWVRVAWYWIVKRSLPNVSLLPAVAGISVSDGECPNSKASSGKVVMTRMWYTIPHPDTGVLQRDFTICSWCLANIETIFYPLRGTFVPASPTPCPATCDLVWTSENKRCAAYVELLSDTAAATADTGLRDLRKLAAYVERFARIPECPRDVVVKRPCYTMPNVPEFTVCEECYGETVKPDRQRGAQLAAQFNATPTHLPDGFTCQLYSDRMRRVWQQAIANNDLAFLRLRVAERRTKEKEIGAKMEALRARNEMLKAQAHSYSQMSMIQWQHAFSLNCIANSDLYSTTTTHVSIKFSKVYAI